MKSVFALFLVMGIIFQPAFLMAADEAAAKKPAGDAAVAADDKADLEDWELGKDDLAAEDEDLKLDEEDDATAKDAEAAVPAVPAAAKPAQ